MNTDVDEAKWVGNHSIGLLPRSFFGRFVSRLLNRTNRAREVLVLLIASVMAGGCGRDSIMPPAEVRLPEYQAESLYSEELCVVSERGELRRG